MTKVVGLLFLLCLWCASYQTVASTLKIGLLEYPPHVTIKNGQVSGPIIKYLKQMYHQEFQDIQFILMPDRRGIIELKKGSVDLLFPYIERGEHLQIMSESLLNVVPGLCFKKPKYIPFLSAPGALDYLDIGIPPNLPLVPVFSRSSVNLKVIEGSDALKRGIQLLLLERIDGFYHPNPAHVYHYKNPLSQKVACSLFYGFSKPVELALSSNLTKDMQVKLSAIFKQEIKKKPYEYFLIDEQ